MPKGKINRRNMRCSREVAFLIAQGASLLITSSPDVNSPTASTVIAASLERQAELEGLCEKKGRKIDYAAVMAPDIDRFARSAGLPPAKSVGGRFLLSVSGATVIRAIDLAAAHLTVDAFDVAVRPEFVVRLSLRILLLSAQGDCAVPTLPIDAY